MISVFKAFSLLSFLAFLTSACLADLVAPPTPYVVSSADGSHYFKMVPDKKDKWNTAKAKGALFEVRSGNDKVLYTVSGWYSYQVFISNDGKYLIRMGNPTTDPPKSSDLAIAFYVDGQEKKRYSTLDLLTDPSKAPKSISFYRWLQSIDAEYMLTNWFSVVTVENLQVTFDISTGEIKFKEPVKGAKSK